MLSVIVRTIAVAAVSFYVSVSPTQALAAFPILTFDADNQGWTIAGSNTDYGPPTIDGGTAVAWDNRGNPGGALSIGDNYYSTWISAPAAFRGNQSDMYGQSFSYDILIRYSDITSFPYPSAAIRSGDLTLLYSIATPPLFAWNRRVVTFDPNLWTVDVGSGTPSPGATATAQQLQTVLGSLERLYLLTEWRTGPDDTSVDNIGSGLDAGLQGDYNHNGTVNAPDYVTWRSQLGSVFTQTDYAIWRQNFGKTAPGVSAGQVPEPTSITFFLPPSCRRRVVSDSGFSQCGSRLRARAF